MLSRNNHAARIRLAAALLACSAASSAAAQTAFTLEGKPLNPFPGPPGKPIVLIFVRTDCPISNRYAPALRNLFDSTYHLLATFWLVYPDKSDSPQAIRQYLSEYGYSLPALRDPEHVLAKLGHVQITPEVAVFDRNHQLAYDGRIDDRYVDLGRVRAAPTKNELEDAVRSALAGKPVAKSEVRGVGCYIADLE